MVMKAVSAAGLGRTDLAVELLQSLPAEPAELVIVPHVDEGEPGARVLHVGIVQVAAVDGAVVLDRGRDVEVGDPLAMGITGDVADAAVVAETGAGARA